MYVIIAGGGKVGHYLTRALIDAGHEVLLIDKDRSRVDYLTEDLGESVTFGDACEVRNYARNRNGTRGCGSRGYRR